MKTIKLGALNVPAMAVGCWRIAEMDESSLCRLVETAIEHGANFFDHADIYGGGKCEELFGNAIKVNRDKIILQSKCGIRKGVLPSTPCSMYDFSKEHILDSVDGILKRLRTDYLDVLLLHRPDALCQPEDVAEAFDKLQSSGKVRNFGVSNHNPGQIRLLQKYVKQPIVANQLQLSIADSTMISEGMHVNMQTDEALNRNGGVLDFCRLNDITIQTWSPLQSQRIKGVFLNDNELYADLNKIINRIAEEHKASATSIALAWIHRHPANMQIVTGTTNAERLLEYIKASDIVLTREEWYEIYLAAGNTTP